MNVRSISITLSIALTALVSFLPGKVQCSPYIISDDRIRSLDITPVLGRGYSIMTNSYQSICLMVDETTVPSYNYDYSFYDYSSTTSRSTKVAKSLSYSFSYWWIRAKVNRNSNTNTNSESETRYISASMRIERYYSSVREEISALTNDAKTILSRQDYVGFFKSCGPTYIRGIRRAQEVTALFIYKSQSSETSRRYAYSVQVSGWYRRRVNYSGASNSNTRNESNSLQIIIKGYGLGLHADGSETFVAQNLEDYQRVMKFAFRTMTVNEDAHHIGMVYGMEVVPWVENTAFQVEASLLDEAVEIPLIPSLIPRAFRITDITDINFDNTSDETRAEFTCKEPSFDKDKYGMCCDIEALYDMTNREYNDDSPSERVCRPMRVLEPMVIKDNMAANGEFIARLDRSVRYKLNQLATLERCISAAQAIPDRYNFYILKGQDMVKYDGAIDLDFSVFELKMALDPFNDYAMVKHMAKELDEFLDMFIQPCISALFGSNFGSSPDTEPSFFMAYPWHAHDECTKLSCLANSMRWDRSNPEGGCIPSMISGKDSPQYDAATDDNNCNKDITGDALTCKHEAAPMVAHHGKTTKCWSKTVARGRVDFFMDNFCMPEITPDKISNQAQQSLYEGFLEGCAQFAVGGDTGTDSSAIASRTLKMNVALRKPTTQISNYAGTQPSRAVDGNTGGKWWHNSVTHTNRAQGAWWEVDLEDEYDVTEIVLYNREDCCQNRLNTAVVKVYLADGNPVEKSLIQFTRTGQKYSYTFGVGETDRVVKVRVQLDGNDYLSLAEVEVMARVNVKEQCEDILLPNEYCYSWDGNYGLVYQTDGNLVLYDMKTGVGLWNTQTYGRTVNQARLINGRLEVLDAEGNNAFSKDVRVGTNLDYYMKVTTEGQLKVYDSTTDAEVWEAHFEGEYKIRSLWHSTILKRDDASGGFLMSSGSSNDQHATITHKGDGKYSIRVNGKYMKATGTGHYRDIIQSDGDFNDDTHWYIRLFKDRGSVSIRNVEYDNYLRGMNSGNGLNVDTQTFIGGWERFGLESI